MSLLNKICFKKDLNLYKFLILNKVNKRGKAHFFPQYKPGPYPKTQEEREKAAKKYNLLPEEYEPFPDDGSGFGDYPKLPEEHVDLKDPWYLWDDDYKRRDFMEPVPTRYLLLQPEVFPSQQSKLSTKESIFYFLLIWGIYNLIIYFGLKLKSHDIVMERQACSPGVVHYSFDLDPYQEPPELAPVIPKPPPKSSYVLLNIPFYPTLQSKYMKF